MAVISEQQIQAAKDRLEAEGYKGGLVKTKIGKTEFIYRALLSKELLEIRDQLQNNPDATEEDFSAMVLARAVVVPEISVDEAKAISDSYGVGVPATLRSKIDLLSGVIPDVVAHFLTDEEVSSLEGWGEPTKEEQAKLAAAEKNPNRSVLMTKVGGFTFVYRNLFGGEYRELEPKGENDDATYRVLNHCILWPKEVDWDEVPAFIPEVLVQKVFLLSGVDVTPSIDEDEEL